MTKIPQKVRKEIAADLTYKVCKLAGYHGHICGGRITMEHALIYAGRQIQEKWAIVSICAAGQEVDQYQDAHTMNKELNQWVALNQATMDDLGRFSRAPYVMLRHTLNKKYGVWVPPTVPKVDEVDEVGIDYSLIGL